MTISGARVSDSALVWPHAVGYVGLTGPNTAAGEPSAEMSDPSHRESAFGCHRAKGALGTVLVVGA